MQRFSLVDGRDYLNKLQDPAFVKTLGPEDLDPLFKSLITDDDLKREYFEIMKSLQSNLELVSNASHAHYRRLSNPYIFDDYRLKKYADKISHHLIKEFGVRALFSNHIGWHLNSDSTYYLTFGSGLAQLYVLQEILVNNCEPEVLSVINELINEKVIDFPWAPLVFKNNQLYVTVNRGEKKIDIDNFDKGLRAMLNANECGKFRDNELTRERVAATLAEEKFNYYKLLIPYYLPKLWPDNPFSVEETQTWFEYLAANKNLKLKFAELINLFKSLHKYNKNANQNDFKNIMGILKDVDANKHTANYIFDMMNIYLFLSSKDKFYSQLDRLEAEVQKYAATLEQGSKSKKILSGYFSKWAKENGFAGKAKILRGIDEGKFFSILANKNIFKDCIPEVPSHGMWSHIMQWWGIFEYRKQTAGFLEHEPIDIYQKLGSDISSFWLPILDDIQVRDPTSPHKINKDILSNKDRWPLLHATVVKQYDKAKSINIYKEHLSTKHGYGDNGSGIVWQSRFFVASGKSTVSEEPASKPPTSTPF